MLRRSRSGSASGATLDDDLGLTRRRRSLSVWQESVLLFVLAVVLAVVVKAFFVQAFYIPSESMEPGLQKNDRILVQKVSYWFGGQPRRGDVVVFSDPGDWLPASEQDRVTGLREVLSKVGLYPAGGHLVKRVIGVPGDTVTCCDAQGRIAVNGHSIDESGYVLNSHTKADCAGPMVSGDDVCHWSSGVVPPGMLWVMGDHRDDSADSSYHLCRTDETDCTRVPFVPERLVVGKVMAVVWPHDHWRILHRPADFADVPAPGATPAPVPDSSQPSPQLSGQPTG